MTPLTDADKAVLKSFKWATEYHLNCEDRGIIFSSCKALKATRTVVTPKTNMRDGGYGDWGIGVVTYSVEGCDEELKTLPELVAALKKTGHWPNEVYP